MTDRKNQLSSAIWGALRPQVTSRSRTDGRKDFRRFCRRNNVEHESRRKKASSSNFDEFFSKVYQNWRILKNSFQFVAIFRNKNGEISKNCVRNCYFSFGAFFPSKKITKPRPLRVVFDRRDSRIFRSDAKTQEPRGRFSPEFRPNFSFQNLGPRCDFRFARIKTE